LAPDNTTSNVTAGSSLVDTDEEIDVVGLSDTEVAVVKTSDEETSPKTGTKLTYPDQFECSPGQANDEGPSPNGMQTGTVQSSGIDLAESDDRIRAGLRAPPFEDDVIDLSDSDDEQGTSHALQHAHER
ncbi:hypothetical protein FRC06_007465, partial [Ceratobasidium sp. 370]